MNMVRIRHIMEMRRACKAPPLLPPKLKKESSEMNDRRGVKDVLDLSFRIQIVAPERFSSKYFYMQLFESQDSSEGPWNIITESDRLEIDEVYDLEDVFGIEFNFERLQWIRIAICEHTDNGKQFRAADMFSIAQVAQNTLTLQLTDQSGYRLTEVEIWSQIRERSQPIMMQIEAKNISNKFASSNSNLFMEIHKIEDDLKKRLLYRSETSKQPKLIWKAFTVQSEDFDEDRQIELNCVSDDDKEGVIGQTIISSEAIKSTEPIPIYNESYKNGRKPCGEIRITKCQQLRVYSFLDYIRCGTNLRYAFAIDFSTRELNNLTREDHLQFSNDVEFVVRSISETVDPFNQSNSFLSYGFGAKIPPQNRDSNNFCLSLDVDASCQGVQGVLSSFAKCHQRVQPLASAKFSQIIYHLAKSAQTSFNKEASYSNYFILFVITRGSIEDLKETVQAAIFSSKAPISIVFIGVGCDGLDEIERIGNAGKRLEFQGRKSERDNLQYVNATKCRLESDNYNEMTATFLDKSLQQIPWQLTSFFMQNHVPPGKSEENLCIPTTNSRRPSSQETTNIEFEEYEPRSNQNIHVRTSSDTRTRRHRITNEMRSMTIDDPRNY